MTNFNYYGEFKKMKKRVEELERQLEDLQSEPKKPAKKKATKKKKTSEESVPEEDLSLLLE